MLVHSINFNGATVMIKKLTRHGNSLAIVLDKGVIDLLNIDTETPLEISTDGSSLLITPVRDEKRRQQFQAALDKTNARYGSALKRLAA
jgi:antitoxin MazE